MDVIALSEAGFAGAVVLRFSTAHRSADALRVRIDLLREASGTLDEERFASLLYPVTFALIIIAFVGQARSTRTSRMESLVAAFLLAAGVRLGGLALNNLVTANAMFVPALYLRFGAAARRCAAAPGPQRRRDDAPPLNLALEEKP